MRPRKTSFRDRALKGWFGVRTRHATALVKKGADPEERDGGRRTPIFQAALVDNGEVTDGLIMADVDIGTRDAFDQTAPMCAASIGACGTVHLLVEARYDINAQDDRRAPP